MAADPRLPTRFSRLARLMLRAGFLAAAATPFVAGAAQAQIGSYRYASIIVDDGNGRVMEAVNADSPRYPASLTKLMTLYMTFDALRNHRITLDQIVPVSARAASMEPTKLGLVPGTRITVEQAILGAITRSANDAACALGELVGGDEDRYAALATQRARDMGMTHTTWRNASGLPNPEQMTTARDLAILAHHLVHDYPEYYHYFSVPEFRWHNQVIPNHDHMLTDYPGADGLKTGYTVAAGHNLVTSALRSNVRLIGVVMGAASNGERDLHMAALLDAGFNQDGVPVEPRPQRRFHLPVLIASAEASTLHVHQTSLRHGKHHGLHVVTRPAAPQPTVSLALAHKPGCGAHHKCGHKTSRRT